MADPTDNLTWNVKLGVWAGMIAIPTLRPYCKRWFFSDTSFGQHDDFEQRQRERATEFRLTIEDSDHGGVSPEQRNALTYFQTVEHRLCDLILTAVLEFGRVHWAQHFEVFNGPNSERRIRDEVFSQLDSPNGLREVVQLAQMVVLEQSKDGMSYLMFDFDCSWDWDHGTGVLVYRNQIIKTDMTMYLLGAISDGNLS